MNNKITYYGEHIFAPHFIFIKGIKNTNDSEVLKLFGVEVIESISIHDYTDSEDEILTYRIGEWFQIIDNWYYKLWHSSIIKDKILELGKSFELFQCSVGDSDDSLDFRYFQNGNLIREFVKDYRGRVTTNFGLELPSEEQIMKLENIEIIVIELAKSLGIPVNPKLEDLKIHKIRTPYNRVG